MVVKCIAMDGFQPPEVSMFVIHLNELMIVLHTHKSTSEVSELIGNGRWSGEHSLKDFVAPHSSK